MCSILVINVHGLTANAPGVTYIGRACKGWKGSALANTHKMSGEATRQASIDGFAADLRQAYKAKSGPMYTEFMRLVKMYQDGQDIILGCWCAPKPCHGDFIREAIIKTANSLKK